MKNVSEFGKALRRRAEQALGEAREPAEPTADMKALVYELQVHEVELRMQNEALLEAQQELQSAFARYRELYDLAPVAYLSLDLQGRIAQANRAAGALLDLDPERLIGEQLSRYVAESQIAVFTQHRRELMALDQRCACLLELMSATGKQREVRLESVLTRDDDAPWRCMIADVTEVNRLQRRLQQAQKLESMNTLASGVAHEFNNLLMGMLGCAEIAFARIGEQPAAREEIAELKRAALRGRSIVTQLLAFARRDDGGREVVDVHEAVRGSLRTLRQLLGDAVALELQLDAVDPFVEGEGGLLDPILMNLAANARDAMPDGGTFRIQTESSTPDLLGAAAGAQIGPRACVVLTVRDTGCGMDARTAARAFDPFFTTKPAGAGTGLGLSMVYGAVRRLGGHVELHSEPGHGTSVVLYMPQAEQRTATAEARLSPQARPTHALVVDADRLVRRTLRHYLQRTGSRMSEAESGEQALALLRKPENDSIEMLIVDVSAPDTKPMRLIAEARAVRPEIGVLLTSAHGKDWLIARGMVDPAVRVLHKPFTAAEFDDALLDALAIRMWERDG